MSNKRKKGRSFLDLSRSNSTHSTTSSEDRRSPLTLYSRLRIGLLFQVLPNTPSPASSPPPSRNRRTRMDERVPSRAVEEEEEDEEWSFDSNCSEASEGSDQDSLGWLNALANSTFEESSWISRKSSEPKRGATTPPPTTTTAIMTETDLLLRRNSMHTWFEDSTVATERRSSPKSQSPFLCYASDEEDTKEDSSNSKFITINKWLDSASHFLDVKS